MEFVAISWPYNSVNISIFAKSKFKVIIIESLHIRHERFPAAFMCLRNLDDLH